MMTGVVSISVGTCSKKILVCGAAPGTVQATALVQAAQKAVKQTAHVRISASQLFIVERMMAIPGKVRNGSQADLTAMPDVGSWASMQRVTSSLRCRPKAFQDQSTPDGGRAVRLL